MVDTAASTAAPVVDKGPGGELVVSAVEAAGEHPDPGLAICNVNSSRI